MKAIIKYFAKKYIITAINDILSTAKVKETMVKTLDIVDKYIYKLKALILFLESVEKKIIDCKLDENEAEDLEKEAVKLVDDIIK